MAGYLGAVPVPQATQHRDTFTATDGQTTFNVQPYTPTFLDVYLNGVRLNAADVTATNGTSVVLVACETDDIVDVISYTAFEVGSLSANSVDSDQYVDGSIDTVHIADAQVTVAKMAANSVDSDQYVDGSIDTAHIADVNVTQAKIADQAINEAKLQVSNAPTNGYMLTAESGNTGGLTWATAPTSSTALGAVGTYAFLHYWGGNAGSSSDQGHVAQPGDTEDASKLYYANKIQDGTDLPIDKSTRPSGTWRVMGNMGMKANSQGSQSTDSATNERSTTVMLRIA